MRTVYVFLLFMSFVYAKDVYVQKNYKITYGDFVDLMELNTSVSIIDGKYAVKAESRAVGAMSFFITNTQRYVSRGVYKNKKFIPSIYVKHSLDGDSKTLKEVFFNHKTKTTTGAIKVFEEEDGLFIISQKEDINISVGMDNDVISTLLSLPYYASSAKNKETFKIRAVDANSDDGFLHMRVLSSKEKLIAKKELRTTLDNIVLLYVGGSIFETDKGELLVSIGNDGIFKEALLKNASFFGDIRLHEVSSVAK